MPTADRTPATSFPAAGLDRRFHAFVVDRLVAWSLYAGAVLLAWQLVDRGAGLGLAVAVVVGTVVLVGLGHALLVGIRGSSPGKALAGLRVVEESTGSPIGVPAALLRTVLLGAATLPTFGLGIATLAWTALADGTGRRRGAHDRATRAVVVDVRPAPVVVEEAAAAPRQVVNLTALRLLPPTTASPAATPTPATTSTPTTTPATPATTPAPVPTAGPAPGPVEQRVPPPADRTVVRVPAVAPARWRVSVDTGESFVLEGLALVGRRPEARTGEPVRHLLPLRSGDMSLSKTHAQLQVAPDGVLVVMDRGSTNGSVLLRQGVPRPLPAGRPVTLVDGDRVRLGDRELTVAREG